MPDPNPASFENSIDTSIVVATCSRAGLLRGALESLMTQGWDAALPIELIVVDDASSDETPALLAEMQRTSPVPFTVLQGTRGGVAAARNLGCAAARGHWLASFDDDQIALPGWLRSLRELADANQAACVGGALALELPEDVAQESLGPRARRVLGEHLLSAAPSRYPAGEFPSTNNVLIRRDVFAQLGGYDTSFAEGGEDKDFFERMAAAGYQLWFQPASRALHITPGTRLERGNLRWTSQRLGASDVRLAQRKHAFFGPLKLALVRSATALLRDVPRLAFMRERHHGREANDVRCSLWYTAGVLRSLAPILFPKLVRSRFLGAMDFRSRNGERVERTRIAKS